MRIALVAGPGGAGSTTIAAALAIGAQQRGRSTVLLSADPAAPTLIPRPAAGLAFDRPDPAAIASDAWPAIAGYLAALGVDGDLDPVELSAVPGAASVAMLLRIADHAGRRDRDVLVVDAGSEVVQLLSVTETVGQLTDRVLPPAARIMRQLGGLLGPRSAGPSTEHGDLVGELLNRLLLAQAVLTAPEMSALHLVTGPERLRRAAAVRLVPALAVRGVGLGRVVVNRAAGSADRADEGLAAWPAAVALVPRQRREPIGTGLQGVADALAAAGDPIDVPAGPALREPAVTPADDGFQLVIPLPMAERDDIDLARSGDDVLITVGGHCRRVELPSVLRRCAVAGAVFADGALLVSFRPDPDRWPRSLATAGAPADSAGASDE